jgi:hypothetical protein
LTIIGADLRRNDITSYQLLLERGGDPNATDKVPECTKDDDYILSHLFLMPHIQYAAIHFYLNSALNTTVAIALYTVRAFVCMYNICRLEKPH